MKNIKILMIALMIAAFASACGAGDDQNDFATCADVGQAITYCQNQIAGEALHGEDYAAKVEGQCMSKPDKGCNACIFDQPCSPAEGKTPLDFCIEMEKCPAYELE